MGTGSYADDFLITFNQAWTFDCKPKFSKIANLQTIPVELPLFIYFYFYLHF